MLTVPKTDTKHMISTHAFGQMKDGVVIVNTARGAVVDERALVKALDSGKVASAGLDVYEDEPQVHPDLVANPHVLLLPHMGTWTVEVSNISLIRMFSSSFQIMRRGYVVQGVHGCMSSIARL